MGPYWLFPLLYLMLADRLPTSWGDASTLRLIAQPVPVGCPIRNGHRDAPALCPGLPPGCDQHVLHLPRGRWAEWQTLVLYVTQFQFQVLTSGIGTVHRHTSSPHHANTVELSPLFEDLFVLLAGGVPVATAAVAGLDPPRERTDDADGWLYLGSLCAHTHSGGGAVLIGYLQSLVAAHPGRWRGIHASAWDDAGAAAYATQGFRIEWGREAYWPRVPS